MCYCISPICQGHTDLSVATVRFRSPSLFAPHRGRARRRAQFQRLRLLGLGEAHRLLKGGLALIKLVLGERAGKAVQFRIPHMLAGHPRCCLMRLNPGVVAFYVKCNVARLSPGLSMRSRLFDERLRAALGDCLMWFTRSLRWRRQWDTPLVT